MNRQLSLLATATFVRPPTLMYSTAPSCSDASARTMPNADRSMPSISRPAPSTAAATRSTISLRTATTTTRVRGPSGVSTVPSDWKSSTASSIGIGMWSGAASRTAAARAFGSSTTVGRSSVRTTMRWWAMPSRTRLGNSFSAKSVLSASARAMGSATSPSRITPGASSATAPRVSVRVPSTLTSAAARWPASSSRPTTLLWGDRFLRNTGVLSSYPVAGLDTSLDPSPGVKRTKRARGPASRRNFRSVSWGLPGAVGRAAALARLCRRSG